MHSTYLKDRMPHTVCSQDSLEYTASRGTASACRVVIFQPGFGGLTQAQPGSSFKADAKSIWLLCTERDASGLCGL